RDPEGALERGWTIAPTCELGVRRVEPALEREAGRALEQVGDLGTAWEGGSEGAGISAHRGRNPTFDQGRRGRWSTASRRPHDQGGQNRKSHGHEPPPADGANGLRVYTGREETRGPGTFVPGAADSGRRPV